MSLPRDSVSRVRCIVIDDCRKLLNTSVPYRKICNDISENIVVVSSGCLARIKCPGSWTCIQIYYIILYIIPESESYVTTDGQPASLSWSKAPFWGLRPDLYYCLTVAGLLIWGALSDERTGLSFAIATGPRQRSHFLVRVP
jgi:hypothetical protein